MFAAMTNFESENILFIITKPTMSNYAQLQWDHNYDALLDYVRKYDQLPKKQENHNGINLGSWVIRQRARQSSLTSEQLNRLDAVPQWNWGNCSWRDWFAILQDYVANYHRIPRQKCIYWKFRLGSWVVSQRNKRVLLSADNIALLESIPGWEWKVRTYSKSWQHSYRALYDIVQRFGHIPNISRKHARWANAQLNRLKSLSGEQLELITTIPNWCPDLWHTTYAAASINPDAHADWIESQRNLRSFLMPSQISALEMLPNWHWSEFGTIESSEWFVYYMAAYEFIQSNNRMVYPDDKVNDMELGVWVREQHRAKTRGIISWEHERALNSIPGWFWQIPSKEWLKLYNQLYEYMRDHDDTMPAESTDLGKWAGRQQKMDKYLDEYKIFVLEQIPGWQF
jgi:hypothetical protein